MSDLMRALIKSLIANGVKVPADEPVCLGGEKVSPAYNLDAIILDFSEHDKVFEDKIAKLVKENAKVYQENMHLEEQCVKKEDEIYKLKIENKELKQRIAELESKETETVSEIDTSTPIDCANSLINHLTLLEASLIMPERCVRTFDIDELEQIAEHLLVYCKHNKESE